MANISNADVINAWNAGRQIVRDHYARTGSLGSRAIRTNSFANACYDQNTLAELNLSRGGRPDSVDMQNWGISQREWAEQIGAAFEALAIRQEEAE